MSANHPAFVEGPPLAGPLPAVTVPRFIRERARSRSQAVALIDGTSGRQMRYGELDQAIGRFAAGLAALGLRAGDTLLLCAPNSPEWVIAALGTMAAGGVVSGANPTSGAAELAHQMRDARVRFVVTVPPSLPVLREAAAQAGCETVILLGGNDETTVPFAQLMANTDPEPDTAQDPDALATLPYSSGTTGLAKGVELTHRMLLANVCQVSEAMPVPQGTVALAFLPMFHIFGFTVVSLCGLAAGAVLVTLPRFEPEAFLRAIQDHKVQRLSLVPPVLQFLAMHPMVDSFDLTSLDLIGCGAAPLGAALERRAAERLKCTVLQGFGMTESSGVVSVTRRDDIRSGSSGRLLPGTQGRIVDPANGVDLPRGQAGELWFRGPQALRGYLGQPLATAATLTVDGWVRTGDIGYFDDHGHLYITDRLKELVKVKGYQVAPAELEALLLTHPDVADAAVIGRPDERAGEVPVAYVVARGKLDAPALKAWVAERVADYKQLAEVMPCDAIPKSPTGKILRRVLRALDQAARG